MPLPTDQTFDPEPPAEGTKFDSDATYTWAPGVSSHLYWAIVDLDGSRRVVGYSVAGGTDRMVERFPDHDAYLIHRNSTERHQNGGFGTSPKPANLDRFSYLAYDWTLTPDPVNQYAYLPRWRADVARFAHGFDALPGFESFRQLSSAQKATAFRVGQTIGGHAWERLGFWLTYDAALSDDWKLPIVMDPVKKAREAVCIECQSETAARRLALSIDATAFAAKLAAGHIHGTDRSVNPWAPGDLLTVRPAVSEEVTLETSISVLVASFNGARDYYDAHVAHEVMVHDHG